jgi:hypothetical protein
MRPHPYLRAYMAGILVPTLFLLVIMSVYSLFRFRLYLEVPSQFVLAMPARPLTRAMVFPMAIVPNLWGAWNVLHLKLRSRVRVSLGAFGSILPVMLFPGGIALARLLDVFTIQWWLAIPIIPIGMAVYYLAWKYLVGFLNEEMGIA